jgi:hypothetical protein
MRKNYEIIKSIVLGNIAIYMYSLVTKKANLDGKIIDTKYISIKETSNIIEKYNDFTQISNKINLP